MSSALRQSHYVLHASGFSQFPLTVRFAPRLIPLQKPASRPEFFPA